MSQFAYTIIQPALLRGESGTTTSLGDGWRGARVEHRKDFVAGSVHRLRGRRLTQPEGHCRKLASVCGDLRPIVRLGSSTGDLSGDAVTDRRLANLGAAWGFLRLEPTEPELDLLHRSLDTWKGIGLISGCYRQRLRLVQSHCRRRAGGHRQWGTG